MPYAPVLRPIFTYSKLLWYMFRWLKRKEKSLLKKEEQAIVLQAIQEAERRTSGEIRVFVEPRCSYVDSMDRAKEVFFKLKMDKTEDRNAVLG